MSAVGLGGQELVFTVPGDSKAWADMVSARERLFAGLPLAALANAVGQPPEKILHCLPPSEHQVVLLLLDTALAEGDAATARLILAGLLVDKAQTPSHFTIQLADKVRLTLAVPVAERLLQGPVWRKTIAEYQAATTPGALKDEGRLVYTATLMPREVMPAFVKSLEPLTPGTARAARDYADLILALPPSASAS